MTNPSSGPMAGSVPLGVLAILWLVGWTLRVPILAAPPLATRISDSYSLGEAGVGSLTMLPILAVAFGALPAAWVITRFGIRASIVGGLVVMAIASLLRGQVPGVTMLFAMSTIMGLGVALFQTALPAATKVWTPSNVALGSTVYLNGMMLGELSGAGLTLPLVLPAAGGDWRLALILWSVPVLLIALLVWFARFPKAPADEVSDAEIKPTALPKWNDPRAWQYGLLLASSVVAFYVVNAFSGSLLQARGESDALAGLLFAFNATPLLASVALVFAPSWIGKRKPLAISAVFAMIGLTGFILFDGWLSWCSALVAGFAATIELILLVSLPPSIAKGSAVTRLSAGMTLIGYGIAFLLPLAGGWLADRSSHAEMALVPSLLLTIVALAALGRKAHYPIYK